LEKGQGLNLPYDLFAPVYDHFFGPESAGDTLRALDRLLLRHLLRGASVLDLCCGTGQLSAALLQKGYAITGVDNSTAMLARARERAPGAHFELADARDFQPPRRFDAVISAYNSLSHMIEPADLLKALRNVRTALQPDAMFVFDLYSEAAYRERWRGSFAKVDDDYACIIRASYDALSHTGENLATAFHRSAEWRRADVRLLSRCYPESELRPLLQAAGFGSVERFEAAADLGIESAAGRVFWRCKARP
jgi:SAM-dependent methyltransferase